MKAKQNFLILILFSCLSNWMHAQAYLKVNPLALAVGFKGADCEIGIGHKMSIQLHAYKSEDSEVPLVLGGWGFGGALRFYISKNAVLEEYLPKGFFISPNFKTLISDYGSNRTSIGFLFGKQWLYNKERVSVEVAIGTSLLINNFLEFYKVPQTSFSIGYRLWKGNE
jgi:hypothetical protein